MAYETLNSLDILTMTLNMIGKDGPIVVDIMMATHNDDLEHTDYKLWKKLIENGCVIVGEKDRKINVDDVQKMTKTLKKEMSRKEYQNGRTYFFEGIKKSSKGWEFVWGS